MAETFHIPNLYGANNYAQFKMYLGLLGYKNSIPSEETFRMFHCDDWKWEIFISHVEEAVRNGIAIPKIEIK